MNPCIRTGFHAYVIPSGRFIYGDAFQVNETFIFRIIRVSELPIINYLNYEINDYAVWWHDERISTLAARPEDVISYGYEGRSILEFDFIKAILNKEQN
jgi:hypothetical protein